MTAISLKTVDRKKNGTTGFRVTDLSGVGDKGWTVR